MKTYPAYKNSKVEMFDKIPESWELVKAKYLFHHVTDKAPANNDMELLSVYTEIGVEPRKDLEQRGNKASTTDDYWIVKKDDIIVNKLLAWMGAIGYSAYDGVTSPAYDVLRKSVPLNSKFYHYLFRCGAYLPEFKRRSRGIMEMRLRLYFDELGQIPLVFPSIQEQEAIVNFLDRKSAQIDTLIEKKLRQIELLQEQRDVMTQNAMRSSEAKSLKLGDVADWTKRPINRQDEELYERIGLYNRGRGIFHKPIAKGVDLGDSDFFEIKDGDFVISGQFAWEGAVALARQEEDGCFASHRYYSLRGKPDYAETAYLFSFFTTQLGDNLLNHHSRGAAGRNRPLNINTLLREKIPVPPLSMQKPITDLIEKTVVLEKNTQKLVDFLQEYRTALISEAVTGKIDVRTAV